MHTAGFRFYTGALATDFVATVGKRRSGGRERLTNQGRLASWLVTTTLCPPGTTTSEAELDYARRLREAVYRLLCVRIEGGTADREDVDTLNVSARQRAPVPQLAGTRQFTLWLLAEDPVGGALGIIACDAVGLLTDQRAESLRACQASDCGLVYLDLSQGRNRRWCSMRECGNRAKAAAHRARVAGAAT